MNQPPTPVPPIDVPPEPYQMGFYAYQQLGCNIYDASQYASLVGDVVHPTTLAPLTAFTVGQEVIAGSWRFTITEVGNNTVQGENNGLLMWGFKREDGSWGAGFGNKAAILRAVF